MLVGVKKIFLSVLFLTVAGLTEGLFAQEYRRTRTEVIEDVVLRDSTSVNSYYREGTAFIQFPVGKSVIDVAFGNNAEELGKIRGNLDLIKQQEAVEITRVIITGYGSPDGGYSINERLSVERAQAMIDFMKNAYSSYFTDKTQFEISSIPEDWDGLRKLVEEDGYLTEDKKIQVYNVIDFFSDVDARDAELVKIDDGKTYRYMLNNLYPRLRRVYWRIDFRIDETVLHQIADTVHTVVELPGDTVAYSSYVNKPVVKEVKEPKKIIPYRPTFSLKTNLLYWAALTPNLTAEVYFADKHSFAVEAGYGNWKINNATKDWKYAILMATGEYRYWIDDTSKGHFVGVNGGWGKYNFRTTSQDVHGTGDQGYAYGGGILYGYALPVTRFFNVEFAIGVGYLRVDNVEYIKYKKPNGERVFLHNRDRHTNYVGPTKGSISLVYKF